MQILPDKPQSIPRLIVLSVQLWLHDWQQLFVLSFIAALVGVAPHFFLPEFNTAQPVQFIKAIGEHAAFVPIYVLVSLFFFSVIIYKVHMDIANKPGGIREAFAMASKRYLYLVAGFIVATIAVLLGFILFVIPGIIIMFLLIYTQPMIIIDNKGPIEACRYSISLVWGQWWRTFVTMGLVLLGFFFLASAIEKITLELWHLQHPGGGIWVSYNIFRLILNSLYYPLYVSVLLVLMHDLELRVVERKLTSTITITQEGDWLS